MKNNRLFLFAAVAICLMMNTSCKKASNTQMPFDCTDWSYISTNTTIPAGIYTVTCNIEVANGATLTIAPGTTLLFTQNSYITVDAGASLTAAGTSQQPIVFKGSQAVPGYWQGVLINSVSLNNTFSYCTFSNGGGSSGGQFGANVTMTDATAGFTNCTFSNSSDAGIYIAGGTTNATYFNTFTNNTMTGNGSYPIVTKIRGASTIGSGCSFSGNVNNYIGILSGTTSVNLTLGPQPVPYLLMQTGSDAGITVTGALTLSPGTNIAMGSGISILVNTPGSISAVGTSASPISITGQQATAGYWGSILVNSQSTQNNFQYCNFSYGGGVPANAIEINESAVGMLSTYMYIPVPRSLNVTNCTFSNSASSGIYVSATDGPPTVPPTYNASITTANTFTACSPNVQQ